MNTKIVVGVTRGMGIDRIRNWAISVGKLEDSDVHLICMDKEVAEDLRKLCDANRVAIIHSPDDNSRIHHQRYFQAWKHVRGLIGYEIVLWTDVADVVFQVPHLRWLEDALREHYWCIGSEGVLFREEPWNNDNMKRTFPHHFNDMQSEEILCSGVIGGRFEQMKELLFNIYNFSAALTGHEIVDQSALNVMMLNHLFRSRTRIANTGGHYMVHCAVSGPTPFFKGWGFDKVYRYGLPVMQKDGIVCNQYHEPFCVLHQYNRIPEWKALVDKRYA